jgi:hypothetical protein
MRNHDDTAPQPRLGVCYYPEHWPESTWSEDAQRMRATGLTWVRIGEFAWSALEPSPGGYAWSWLDRAIDTLGHAGLLVGARHPHRHPTEVAGRHHARHAPRRARRACARPRLAASPRLRARGVSRGLGHHRRRPCGALRAPRGRARLASRQRVRLPRHRAPGRARHPRCLAALAGGPLRHDRGPQRGVVDHLLVAHLPRLRGGAAPARRRHRDAAWRASRLRPLHLRPGPRLPPTPGGRDPPALARPHDHPQRHALLP